MEPSAPAFPDDDTVSIRTYASTPPPFPDDGKSHFSYTLSSIPYVESFFFIFSHKDFDLPTYEEALLMNEDIAVNIHSIEYSFAQIHVKTNK